MNAQKHKVWWIVGLVVAGALLTAMKEDTPEQPVEPAATPAVAEAPARLAVETATPTATPTTAPPGARPYFPPLSLVECIDQIREVRSKVPTTSVPISEVPFIADRISRRVQSIFNYLKFRDDLHSSLADYQWGFLGDDKVQNDPGQADHDTLIFDPPQRRISALSLSVVNGDVHIHRLKVYDEFNALRQEWDFGKRPVLLRNLIPRREVFHLWTRTTISRIEIEYSVANPARATDVPRVSFFGGRTERVEHIKTAMRHLQEAEESVQKLLLDSAGEPTMPPEKWSTTLIQLGRAEQQILNFLRQQEQGN